MNDSPQSEVGSDPLRAQDFDGHIEATWVRRGNQLVPAMVVSGVTYVAGIVPWHFQARNLDAGDVSIATGINDPKLVAIRQAILATAGTVTAATVSKPGLRRYDAATFLLGATPLFVLEWLAVSFAKKYTHYETIGLRFSAAQALAAALGRVALGCAPFQIKPKK